MKTYMSMTVVPVYGCLTDLVEHTSKGTIQIGPDLDTNAMGKLIEQSILSLRKNGEDARQANYSFRITFK